jgi:hypothetical protein
MTQLFPPMQKLKLLALCPWSHLIDEGGRERENKEKIEKKRERLTNSESKRVTETN